MSPRQILIRCTVVNAKGDTSTRYIPASEFGLWQYAMVNRHRIEVVRASVGLWVGDAEYQRNDQLFERTLESDEGGAAGLQRVDRLDLSLYDEKLGMCHLVRRFCGHVDTATLIVRLTERLGSADAQHEITAGHFVGAKDVPDLRRLSRPIATLTDNITRAVVALTQSEQAS